jgi:AraC-like DNA-binding protein
MEMVFSTADVHPRDRFSYWHEIACERIVKHNSVPACRPTFEAALAAGTLADVGLLQFENSPMNIARTARQVAQATDDDLFICRQISGILRLEQNGRSLALESGDFTLVDPLIPYAGRFCINSKLLVLKVPRRSLEARVGKTPGLVARALKPSAPEAGLTSSFLAMLPDYAGRTRADAAAIIADQVLDLMAVSLMALMGAQAPRVSSAHALVAMKLRATIEARLTDPALDPATVAAAAGISVRYANVVLARQGTSIMRLVQSRRLSRCRIALEDPLQSHRTLSEIAYGWGFSDMTHFSRKFKEAYGILPSDFRTLAKQVS